MGARRYRAARARRLLARPADQLVVLGVCVHDSSLARPLILPPDGLWLPIGGSDGDGALWEMARVLPSPRRAGTGPSPGSPSRARRPQLEPRAHVCAGSGATA